MHRSALLAGLALVLVGCLGPAADVGRQSSPTATPYPDEVVPFPDGPKDRPELPATLTADTASQYTKTHEFRYTYNELWEGSGTEVGMSEHSCSVESTEQYRSGFVVTLRCTAYVNRPVDGGTSTRTEHADLPPWTVRYYVDEDSVVRTEVE